MRSHDGGAESQSRGAVDSGPVHPLRDTEVASTGVRADQIIFEFAEGQHGVVSRRQLLIRGVSKHVVEHRVRTAQLRAVHAGVYRMGPVVSPRAREMAAALTCEGSVVSHRSVAWLWRLSTPQPSGEPVDLTHAVRQGRRPGVRVYRSSLAADETTVLDGIPVTSVGRTLIDLSRVMSPREIERAVAHADREHPMLLEQLPSLLDRHARRGGVRRLRQVLASPAGAALTRSEAEERLLSLIRAACLPAPRTNAIVHGYEVDCYWKHARLAVEVDGYAWHGSARSFVRDRKRDAALTAAGIHVLRLTWQQLADEREKTLVQLTQALLRLGA